jgi:hypothetical protein
VLTSRSHAAPFDCCSLHYAECAVLWYVLTSHFRVAAPFAQLLV